MKVYSLLCFTHQFTMGYCYKNESEWEWEYLKVASEKHYWKPVNHLFCSKQVLMVSIKPLF